jgi:hypothetical protein
MTNEINETTNLENTITLIFSLYFHELANLSYNIIENCNIIFSETENSSVEQYIKVSPELHSRINIVLINSANIKKLIKTHNYKNKKESDEVFKMRQLRSEILWNALKDINITEILNTKVRNSIEHFDEYLDEWLTNIETYHDKECLMGIYNMTLSDKKAYPYDVFPIRMYIAKERTFYNLRYAINIGKLFQEASAIFERMKNYNVLSDNNEVGALMLPINTNNDK